MRLHVSLQRSALQEALTTGEARKARTVFCSVHACNVASDCVLLHSRIRTHVALVQLFTSLSESMDAQLALAGEVAFARGTLEAGVREMEIHVLLQVGAHLKAAATLRTGVCAIDVL